MLATLPGFLFNANVGMSDAVGTAAAVAGVLALAAALDRPERLPLAAVVGGLALGVRPQVAYALIPVGAAALVCAARARRWRPLLLAIAAGTAAAAASWVPAILITGPDRFFGAVRGQASRVVIAESAGRFSARRFPCWPTTGCWRRSGRPPSPGCSGSSFSWGGGALARGRRRLVAVCLASGAAYLVLAVGTMHYVSSVRYVLPALPFFAVLAAGVAATERPFARRAAVAVAAAWSLYAALAVAGPSLDIRRRRPAPASEAMTWIAARYDPGETLIYYVGRLAPHIRMVLDPQGFTVKQAKPGEPYHAGLQPDGVVLLVSEKVIPVPRCCSRRVERAVPRPSLQERYARCVVAQALPSPGEEALTATLRALATPELLAAAPRSSLLLVPAAAHGKGKLGAFWSTDLVVMAPEEELRRPWSSASSNARMDRAQSRISAGRCSRAGRCCFATCSRSRWPIRGSRPSRFGQARLLLHCGGPTIGVGRQTKGTSGSCRRCRGKPLRARPPSTSERHGRRGSRRAATSASSTSARGRPRWCSRSLRRRHHVPPGRGSGTGERAAQRPRRGGRGTAAAGDIPLDGSGRRLRGDRRAGERAGDLSLAVTSGGTIATTPRRSDARPSAR